jgi:broad specificity phosphatase PhoE
MSLIYVRHGETNLNGPAGSSEERLRGWLPADLTPKGIKQAQATAETLKGIQPSSFHTSDLPRAIQTADHISKVIGMPANPTFNLRDWHTGDMAGQRFPDIKDQLFHHMDNPDEPAPNGEALNSYLGRFLPFVKQLVEDKDPHLVVGHARGTQVLHALSAGNGQFLHPEVLKGKPAVDPGGVMIISHDWTMTPDHKGK